MDPVSLLLAFLIVNAATAGWGTSTLAAVPSAAGGALRALWNGGGSTGSRGGSTSGTRGGRGGSGRSTGKGKGRGSAAVKSPAVESSTWGHVRGGFADGWDRGWTKSRDRRRARWERVHGWWRDRREDPTRHPVDGERCTWQTSSPHVHPLYQRFCGEPVEPGHLLCPDHLKRQRQDGWVDGTGNRYFDPVPAPPPAVVPAPRDESTDEPQTPPAAPVSGEPPKEGTSMADVSATQSVTFWEDIADQVSRQVEAEQSAELAVNGAADVKDKIRGHAQQVADEFSGLIEAAKGSSHEYASTYRS